jgi:transmembrane sensor
MSSNIQIEEKAAAWLLRQEEAGWSAADQSEFDAWLNESTLHRVAYYRLEYGWRRADRIVALHVPATPSRSRSYPALSSWRHALVALVVALTIAGVCMHLLAAGTAPPRTYKTEIGERATFSLDDGTRVDLNTASLLRVSITKKSRTVWLVDGEGYFEVTHDASRPFSIHANGRLVTVLGTKFSVHNNADKLTVAVVEGRVQVDPTTAPQVIATAGDIVTAQGSGVVIGHRTADGLAEMLSWRQGFITFDQDSLAAAAAEFNRYNRKQLVVDPRAANAIRIGGRFDAENVEAFARLLQQAYRLNVRDKGSVIEISGMKETP